MMDRKWSVQLAAAIFRSTSTPAPLGDASMSVNAGDTGSLSGSTGSLRDVEKQQIIRRARADGMA